ncbi:MAG: hypothetical protein HKO57_15315, partial [Akkermansiaceae bacterium]|nr:hypothetical protein [Akkermansiaceae bacterium]
MDIYRGLRIGVVWTLGCAAALVAPAQEARRLVEQLGAESYKDREEASQQLWAMGERALAILGEAESDQDPEVAYRARILLQRIQTGILPGTPKEIIDLVQRYHRGGPMSKKAAMEELRKIGAFPQMLRLYRFEKDPDARQACAELVEEAVVPAVEAKLAGGELDAAEILLELAPPNEANLRRLAAIYRTRGKLDAKLAEMDGAIERGDLARMEAAGKREFHSRRLALLRSKGDLAAARTVAEEMERDDLLAAFALMDGNPVPYLDWFIAREAKPVARIHAEVVRQRWTGDREAEAKLTRSILTFAKEGGEEREPAMTSLLLLGKRDDVLPLMQGEFRTSLFEYYDAVELPDSALAAVGYMPGEDDRKKWLAARTSAFTEDWNDGDAARAEILQVAGFLQRRGNTADARALIKTVSDIAENHAQNTWLEFLSELGDGDEAASMELAFDLAAAKLEADGEDARPAVLMSSLFGEGDSAMRLWTRIGEISDAAPPDRLRLLGGIYGRLPVPVAELDDLLEKLRAGIDEADAKERRQMLVDLLEPAMTRDSAGDVVELLERLAAIDGPERWAKLLATYFGYLADWKKSAAQWEVVIANEDTTDPYSLAAHAAVLMHLGQKEKAERLLREVEMRSLDESLKLLRLAMTLQVWGAGEIAERYWEKLFLTNSPSDWYWRSAAGQGVGYAQDRRQWRRAAAFAEVQGLGYLRSNPTLMINPVVYLRSRLSADLFRGLALAEEGDAAGGESLLEGAFEILVGDGVLADDFFPLVRQAGLAELHDRLFARAYLRLEESIKSYPGAHNSYNGAAWLASRAVRNLDDA